MRNSDKRPSRGLPAAARPGRPARKRAIALAAIAGPLALSACASGASGEANGEVEQVELRVNSSLEPSHILSKGGKWFADELEEASNGRIETTFSDSGSLVGGPDELTALSSGTVDVGSIVGSYHAGVADYLAATMTLPYVGNLETLQKITRKTWDDAQADVDDQGIKLLFSIPIRTEFYFRDEVPCKDPDWSGQKVRSHGGYAEDVVTLFEGDPQFMPSSEIPTAISTGVIDSFSTSLHTWWGAKLYENAGFVCNSDGEYAGPMFYGMNKSVWDGLDEETQELVLNVAERAEDYSYKTAKDLDEEILAEARDTDGIQIVTQSEEDKEAVRERLEPIYDKFTKDLGDAAQRYLDAAEEVG